MTTLELSKDCFVRMLIYYMPKVQSINVMLQALHEWKHMQATDCHEALVLLASRRSLHIASKRQGCSCEKLRGHHLVLM